jgi:omega-6 fatty acid desaturase (delta-12 desaturase)
MPEMQIVEPLTLRKSFRSAWLDLWDEDQQRLIDFGSLKPAS